MRSNKWLWANLSLSAAVAAAAALSGRRTDWRSSVSGRSCPTGPRAHVRGDRLGGRGRCVKELIGFIARLGLALVAGLLGTIPLAMVAAYRGWRYLNGWALAHGTFVVVAPLLVVVAYIALGLVPGLRDPFEPQ